MLKTIFAVYLFVIYEKIGWILPTTNSTLIVVWKRFKQLPILTYVFVF